VLLSKNLLPMHVCTSSGLLYGVCTCTCTYPKWVNFGEPWNGNVIFCDHLETLRQFGISCGKFLPFWQRQILYKTNLATLAYLHGSLKCFQTKPLQLKINYFISWPRGLCMYMWGIVSAESIWVVSRVTRMGEFSPFGWLFTLGSFCESYRSSTNNWAMYFFLVKVLY
jgi:hypothetical protein